MKRRILLVVIAMTLVVVYCLFSPASRDRRLVKELSSLAFAEDTEDYLIHINSYGEVDNSYREIKNTEDKQRILRALAQIEYEGAFDGPTYLLAEQEAYSIMIFTSEWHHILIMRNGSPYAQGLPLAKEAAMPQNRIETGGDRDIKVSGTEALLEVVAGFYQTSN